MNYIDALVIGTAGHSDHAKTAMAKALTGIDTDRLTEEKAGGITIELGFANLELEREFAGTFLAGAPVVGSRPTPARVSPGCASNWQS